MSTEAAIQRIVRRLEARVTLDDADRDAVRSLPIGLKTLEPAAYMVREGEPPEHCMFLLSGFAFRHKVTGDGDRQILSVHMPGEFLDLQNSFLPIADHNVQALTRCQTATIPVSALRALGRSRPAIAQAMLIDTLIDAAIFREWIVNVGRRDSLTRIAHLLCEFTLRLQVAGLTDAYAFELPMTQEQLADATGLTPVHVNRVLKELGRLELITRDRRAVTIVDWDRLRQFGDFSNRYLHMEEGGPNDFASAHEPGTAVA